MEGAFRSPPDVVVVHAPPGGAKELITGRMTPPKTSARVLLTTWESTVFPKEMGDSIAQLYDMVIVPSDFNVEIMSKHEGLKPKLRVLPHAFDPEFWGRGETFLASDLFKGDTRFSFYTVGAWVERKNPIGLLKAYLTAFTSKDDVVLRFLTPAVNQRDVEALGRALNLPDLPTVEFFGREGKKLMDGPKSGWGRLSENDLLAFHYRSNVFVTLTRGEGWGLGAFEAAIVGNPVIAPDYSGHTHFLASYPGYEPIDYMLTPAVVPEQLSNRSMEIGGIKITPMTSAAPPGLSGDQLWAEPDLVQARDCMRAYYKHRGERIRYPDKMLDFSYERVGQEFVDLLHEVKRGP
jgi:glycosyltransferase involved in cell wall biosynthesis